MEVLGQAVTATKGTDQAKLAEYIHKTTFDTVVGKVAFAKNGEWASSRVLMVQFGGIKGNSLDEWKGPGRVTVLEPAEYKTGTVRAPFQDNRK
jgi:branched-chain amino acid transport system substrate-binding protein